MNGMGRGEQFEFNVGSDNWEREGEVSKPININTV